MMYFKLALKNVKKSFKDYAIYFFTLIIGVSIFYMFNSMDSQTLMLELSETKHELINQMNEILSIISIFVAFILAFLIIYASRFLMKRRKKEFGIYMLLGMKKTKISKIILVETLLVGIVSLIVGLVLGIGLSQIMSIIVANMFEANMTKFAFTFSKMALIKTIIYFTIIYIFVMIFNVISVSKCKLIDLIDSHKKSEKVKLKKMWLCITIFVIAIVMLGYAYYNVTLGQKNIESEIDLVFNIILGCISTFLIFWALSGMLLKIALSNKKMYYKKVNAFVIKQLSSKINTTVFSVTIICLMLFITICIFSSAISLKDSMNRKVRELAPVDISISKTLDMDADSYEGTLGNKEAERKMIEDSKYSVIETMNNMNINVDKTFKDVISFNTYSSQELNLGVALGSAKEKALQDNPYLVMEEPETIMKLSDYNKVAKLFGNETYELNDSEYIIISDHEYMTKIRNWALETKPEIQVQGKTYIPKYTECKKANIEIESTETNPGIFILPDNAVNETMRSRNKFLANYNVNNQEEKYNIEKEMTELGEKIPNFYIFTKQYLADSNIGFGAMVVFMGLYIGIVFLISSGAILALKELTESSDNKDRYEVLRKLGVDEKTINKALFKQIGIFFLFPLILAIIHSIPGIQVCNNMIESFGKGNQLLSIILTTSLIIIIYGGYFLISYYTSKRIIKQ